ncbi:hypothetical protein [Levilactobacillus tongjiangensis]|uniref:Tropomyosin n=1 Tax=Levilactobacillus tongjiangensis TaxID=2486023 RepID=A0ABW1SPL0_9LACO|nr:hypothetical protein [Levilactobacillus tongjiangensis]
MGIGRFLTGATLATGVGLAAYLTLTKQDPLTWGKGVRAQTQHTAQKIDDLRGAKNQLTHNVAKLSQAVTDAQPTLDEIQAAVDKFAFKIAPRVAAIEETLAKWDAK